MWWRLRPVQVDRTAYAARWGGLASLAWQLVFMAIPLGLMIYQGFWQQGSDGIQLMDLVYLRVLIRSTCLALATSIGCFLLAYPLAYFLVFRAGRFRLPGLFLIIVPFGINFLLHIYGWFFVLDRNGLLNNLLEHMGLVHTPIDFLNSGGAVYLMMLYYYLPFMVLPVYTQLEKIDPRLFQASHDLGASWWQTVRLVLLPLSLPGIFFGALLVFVPAFGEFAIPEMMGGDRWVFAGSVIAHLVLGPDSLGLGIVFTIMCAAWLALWGAVAWGIARIVQARENML